MRILFEPGKSTKPDRLARITVYPKQCALAPAKEPKVRNRLPRERFGLFTTALRRHAIVAAAVALWVPAVGYGVNLLWRYSTTPGHPASPPAIWPLRASIERNGDQVTLLMFAHPQCGCSKASLGELAIIMAHTHGKLSANVLFYVPRDQPIGWAHTDLWETAETIPGVRVIADSDNAIAGRFGVLTSGQTLVYDAAGRLIFNGGITASRGHSGDSYGQAAIIALFQAHYVPPGALPLTAPVFGCSLRNEQ
jgi:hypothetical protein